MPDRYISAIDVGTNSFHLLIAKIKDNTFEVVHRERAVLRLRSGSESIEHIIQPDKIDEAIGILKIFKTVIDRYKSEINAVATSALRDATNQREVIQKIYQSTGIKINVVSGEEEANLVYLAANYEAVEKSANNLVFDLGGGSLEITLGQAGVVKYQKSFQLGAVRFSQKFFPDFIISDDRIQKCREEIRNTLIPIKSDIKDNIFEKVIGIGGTITAICWLIQKQVLGINQNFQIIPNFKIRVEDFLKVRDLILSKNTFEERITIEGLEKTRADIIPAGILIIDEIINLLDIPMIIASGMSLKEGILINSMRTKH